MNKHEARSVAGSRKTIHVPKSKAAVMSDGCVLAPMTHARVGIFSNAVRALTRR
jgi:hypothetical protein